MVKLTSTEQKLQKVRVKWIIQGLDWGEFSEFDKRFVKQDTLTDWEREFIESVEKQSDEGKLLSDRQMEILEKIYREKGR